jgi:hypothetical protein
MKDLGSNTHQLTSGYQLLPYHQRIKLLRFTRLAVMSAIGLVISNHNLNT